jgi:4-alpha-glucanotransferase
VTDPADAVVDHYIDAFGRVTPISSGVRRSVLRAMGLAGSPRDAAQSPDPVVVLAPGAPLAAPAELVLEDGTDIGVVARLPRDLPIGYHALVRDDGRQLLLTAPPRCHLPRGLREWGWAAQLYAVRSAGSWGCGDLDDLRRLASWSAGLGAGALLVSPLGAPNPGPEPEPSPYYPSTRRFRSPLLLSVEALPAAASHREALAPLAAAGRALNATRAIDRVRALGLKLQALRALWDAGAQGGDGPRGLDAYRAEQGAVLRGWAIFATLTEELGPGWRSWPAAYRDPGSREVAEFAAAHADRVAFHEWVQWLLDEQLRSAAAVGPRIIADLPVGFDPGGYDSWSWQRELAAGASIGAPPDRFNPIGQDWGLPPFVPHLLRVSRYRPFVETVRASLRHAGGLRVDHVLGLFRLWWVPAGAAPADGAYVRYPIDELLAILAIESHRARAVIIGEDLGTVEGGVRRRLAAANVLSTRLLYFEGAQPDHYPHRSLAGVTTHDLPTVAGTWLRSDLRDQVAAGLAPDHAGIGVLRRRLAAATRVGPNAEAREVILAAHAAVAATPAAIVVGALEDALAVEERPNIPGTTGAQRPNWSVALPATLEELATDPFVGQLAEALHRP